MTLSFCLSDGSLLSAHYNFQDSHVYSSERKENDFSEAEESTLINLKPTKKNVPKIKKNDISHPTLTTAPTSDKPQDKWSSTDYIREVTFQLTGKHNFNGRENLEFLREHLNNSINDEAKFFRSVTYRLGVVNFYTDKDKFSYDFQKKASPTKEDFISAFDKFIKS